MKVIGLLTTLILLCLTSSAQASVVTDLYVEAAGVTARCTGKNITEKDAAGLASKIAADANEHLTVSEVMTRVAAAKARSVDCNSPWAQIHIDLAEWVLFAGIAFHNTEQDASVPQQATAESPKTTNR